MRYLLIDEGRLAEHPQAEARNLVSALIRLENSGETENIRQVVGDLIRWLKAPGQDSLRRAFIVWVHRVLLPARLPGVELNPVNDLLELDTMLADRVKEWTHEWKNQGLQEGLQKGRQEGEVLLLRRQLTRRFGELPQWVDTRLTAASSDELEHWADRVLEATTLEGVFNT